MDVGKLCPTTLAYAISKCNQREARLNAAGCGAQARAVRELGDSFRSALSAVNRRAEEIPPPKL